MWSGEKTLETLGILGEPHLADTVILFDLLWEDRGMLKNLCNAGANWSCEIT